MGKYKKDNFLATADMPQPDSEVLYIEMPCRQYLWEVPKGIYK